MANSKLTQLTGVPLPIQNTDLFYMVRGSSYFQVGASGIASAPIFTGMSGQLSENILSQSGIQRPKNIRYIGFSTDGGGSVLSTGLQVYDTIPFNGTIVNWSINVLPSGSIAFDIYKIGSGVTPPTTSIVGNMPPALNAGYFQDTTGLANWATSVTGGDRIGWVIKSATTVTKTTFKIGIQI